MKGKSKFLSLGKPKEKKQPREPRAPLDSETRTFLKLVIVAVLLSGVVTTLMLKNNWSLFNLFDWFAKIIGIDGIIK